MVFYWQKWSLAEFHRWIWEKFMTNFHELFLHGFTKWARNHKSSMKKIWVFMCVLYFRFSYSLSWKHDQTWSLIRLHHLCTLIYASTNDNLCLPSYKKASEYFSWERSEKPYKSKRSFPKVRFQILYLKIKKK